MNLETLGQVIGVGVFVVSIMRLNESINQLNETNREFRVSIEESIKDRRELNVAIEKVTESLKAAHKRIDRLERWYEYAPWSEDD